MQPWSQLPNKIINSSISQSPSPCRGSPASPALDRTPTRLPIAYPLTSPNTHLTTHSPDHSNYYNTKSLACLQTPSSSLELTEMLSKISEIYAAIEDKENDDDSLRLSDQHPTTPSLIAQSNRKLSRIKQELHSLYRHNKSQHPLFPSETPQQLEPCRGHSPNLSSFHDKKSGAEAGLVLGRYPHEYTPTQLPKCQQSFQTQLFLKEKVIYLENELQIKINRLAIAEVQNSEFMRALERAQHENNILSTQIEELRDKMKQLESVRIVSCDEVLKNKGFRPSKSAGPEFFTPSKPTPKDHEFPSFVGKSELARIEEYHNESELQDSASKLRLSQSIFEPEQSPSPSKTQVPGSPHDHAPNSLRVFEQQIREIRQCISSCLIQNKECSSLAPCCPGGDKQKWADEATKGPTPWKKGKKKRKGFEKTKSVIIDKSGENQRESSSKWSSSQANSQAIANGEMSASLQPNQWQLQTPKIK